MPTADDSLSADDFALLELASSALGSGPSPLPSMKLIACLDGAVNAGITGARAVLRKEERVTLLGQVDVAIMHVKVAIDRGEQPMPAVLSLEQADGGLDSLMVLQELRQRLPVWLAAPANGGSA